MEEGSGDDRFCLEEVIAERSCRPKDELSLSSGRIGEDTGLISLPPIPSNKPKSRSYERAARILNSILSTQLLNLPAFKSGTSREKMTNTICIMAFSAYLAKRIEPFDLQRTLNTIVVEIIKLPALFVD